MTYFDYYSNISHFSDNFTPFRSLHTNEADGIRCLTEGGGDVVFIDQNYIPKYLGESDVQKLRKGFILTTVIFSVFLEENKNANWSNLDVNDFRSVCPPESAVDSDCYLSRAAFGMVRFIKSAITIKVLLFFFV